MRGIPCRPLCPQPPGRRHRPPACRPLRSGTTTTAHHGKAVPVVSDFFDFSLYIDADVSVLRDWYVQRFLTFRDTAFHDPRSYFHRYSLLSDDEAIATATAIWERTNFANLQENILPTRPRATLILTKGADHVIETVALRRL